MRQPIIALLLLIVFSLPVHAETAIDRLIKTNTIRCGYVNAPPAMVKDLKSSAFSGFDYEVVNAVAARLLLKTKMTAETGWATVAADLNTGKFDMLCNSYWVNPKSAKFMLFSRPFYYQPVFIVARANDTRFDKSLDALNNPAMKIAILDGDNPYFIAKTDFPAISFNTLPNMTNFIQVLTEVATGKADVTIVDATTFGLFNAANPGKLKIVNPARPVRVFPSSFGFKSGDMALKEAVDAALNEMILDGSLDKIFDRYEKYSNSYYRARIDYTNPYLKL